MKAVSTGSIQTVCQIPVTGVYQIPRGSSLLVLMRWAEARTVAGISAAFIFCNSAAGLLGQGAQLGSLPPETPLYVGAVVVGGLLGSGLSATWLPRVALVRLLALVLVIAGAKLLGT